MTPESLWPIRAAVPVPVVPITVVLLVCKGHGDDPRVIEAHEDEVEQSEGHADLDLDPDLDLDLDLN
jgi:hypothetical protein